MHMRYLPDGIPYLNELARIALPMGLDQQDTVGYFGPTLQKKSGGNSLSFLQKVAWDIFVPPRRAKLPLWLCEGKID